LAEPLARLGLSADQATIAGFVFGLVGAGLVAYRHFWAAVFAFALNRICDGVDGALARRSGPTDRGTFLDIALDFFFYGLVPLSFAIANPQSNALAAAVLLASFIGTGSSFLALSVLAAKNGLSSLPFPKKGIYYIGGLTEGFETILVFAAMCLLPHYFAALAYGFAVFCFFTAALRCIWGYRILSGN
jgi:phosphatidylglycerophosphate synthase